jgi:coenzyme F420-reducing hydrogenase beta subunit
MLHANIINIEKDLCTGCSACYNGCPSSAILMKEDEEGFLFPTVIREKCTECSLCNTLCPAQNNPETKDESRCYAAWNKDKEVRKTSSSGGIFSLLAESILKEEGFVVGAAFDEDFVVKQRIISSIDGLAELVGSKYVQSDVGNTFSETEKILKSGKKVLYSGTPCQIAGLNSYLRKSYENLITIDVLCHAVPSPLVFREYLKDELGEEAKIERIKFKNKENGWRLPNFKIEYSLKGEPKLFEQSLYKNVYIKGFLKDLYNRPSCSTCQYALLPRPGDISLGDFWKIDQYDKKLDDNRGTSLILVNTEKGAILLNEINQLIKIEEVPIEIAKQGNSTLTSPNQPHPLRSDFFNNLHKEEIIANITEKVEKTGVVGLLNFHVSHLNYGALMVAYSLSQKVKELGYTPININFIRPSVVNVKDVDPFDSFRKKYIPMTEECYTYDDLLKQNERLNKIIVGSDQVWLQGWHNEYKFYLNWASGIKTLVSYAASFGKSQFNGRKSEIIAIRDLLKRYDAISVRERTGVDICESTFHTRAEVVLDPTLLFNSDKYDTLIEEAPETNEFDGEYIGFMFVNEANAEKFRHSPLASKIKVVSALKDDENNHRPFGHWLKCIKNSKYMVSDSFHGTCFSLIFKKQLILINNSYSGNERIVNLLSSLRINTDRFVNSVDDINMDLFSKNEIDYEKAYEHLNHMRKDSTAFLERSLKYRPIYKSKFRFSRKYYAAKVLEKLKII